MGNPATSLCIEGPSLRVDNGKVWAAVGSVGKGRMYESVCVWCGSQWVPVIGMCSSSINGVRWMNDTRSSIVAGRRTKGEQSAQNGITKD